MHWIPKFWSVTNHLYLLRKLIFSLTRFLPLIVFYPLDMLIESGILYQPLFYLTKEVKFVLSLYLKQVL